MGLRILIADHQRLTLEAMKQALAQEPGFSVVGEATSGSQALELATRSRPDVALVEMYMPGSIDGLTCAERIRRSCPDTRVIVISSFAGEDAVQAAFRRGAHAFISKAVDPRDIVPAVRQTVQRTVFHPPPEDADDRDSVEGLTSRQLSVLKMVAAGHSNRVISQRLHLSEHTVKFHLGNIFRTLGISNRTEAARWANKHGLVTELPDEEMAPIGEELTIRKIHGELAEDLAPPLPGDLI
jgi:DNA-binding NarL/FixJ family response regulator